MSTKELENALNARIRKLSEELQRDFEDQHKIVHHQLCRAIPHRPSRSWALATLSTAKEVFPDAELHKCMTGVSADDLVRLVYIQAVLT